MFVVFLHSLSSESLIIPASTGSRPLVLSSSLLPVLTGSRYRFDLPRLVAKLATVKVQDRYR